MAKIILFGTGQGADTAYRYFAKDSSHQICGFVVERAYLKSSEFKGLPVVAFEDATKHFPASEYQLFALMGYQGMNQQRARIFNAGKAMGYTFTSYVSSQVSALEMPEIGENCFILDNQTINLDVKIGHNVVMWSGNQIGDRTTIGDHNWIASHVAISGDCHIGSYVFLGLNSTISQNVRIANKSFIGASALITKNTVEGGVYVMPSTPRMKDMDSDKLMSILNPS
jgi:sugar O-acyltransferase (sialic acid O-acetyltransferase NeuD family)